MNAECTLSEKVLLAAYALEESGQSPFSAEALVVSAWKKYPAAFGLREFVEQYPDSGKVMASIVGERGLPRRGWLTRLDQKQYSLTREGRQTARRLLNADGAYASRSAAVVTLARDQEALIQVLLATPAFAKFREDRGVELTFADACRFWGIGESVTGEALDKRLQLFQVKLTELDRQLGSGGQAILPGGRSVTGDDIGRLDELHGFLEERFRRHVALLRKRVAR